MPAGSATALWPCAASAAATASRSEQSAASQDPSAESAVFVTVNVAAGAGAGAASSSAAMSTGRRTVPNLSREHRAVNRLFASGDGPVRHPAARRHDAALRLPPGGGRGAALVGGAQGPV